MCRFLLRSLAAALASLACIPLGAAAATIQDADPRLEAMKVEALESVEGRAKMVQQIVDQLFSFGELGFQEFETQRYLTGLLEDNGFEIELGVAGMPSAWTARWGSDRPVIALGSDVDGIPQSNQKPGVGYREPILSMAPGHGEGHNSGQAVNIVAALAVKEIMERESLSGTLLIWPGIAEEQLGSKAFFVRDGVFEGVDVNLFTHVDSNFSMAWGQNSGNALISAQFSFTGETAHSAGSPWRGRSALDAVMLMAQAWEFKREHLRPAARSHYIIVEGGDQPNVVPQQATIWFFFRERDYALTKEQYDAAILMAEGAALMTGTEIDTIQIVGSAWSRHFNKPVAEATHENIQRVGLPDWSEDDQTLAYGLQRELGQEEQGVAGLDPRAPGTRRPLALVGGRLGRHRRRLLEHADGDAALSRQHTRWPRAQLGQWHFDGHTNRAQGHVGGCEGTGAHPVGSSPQARARGRCMVILQ